MLNEFSKKEAPIQGLAGMGGGVPSRLLTLASGEVTYVDDVFSTYLYDGTGAAQTITNGIDLSGEGGLVWIKERSNADSHALFDTERGVQKYVKSDATDGQYTRTDALSAFNSDGFSFNGAFGAANQSSAEYASWTFRKAPGFFDVVTWTTTSDTAQQISHNLGSTPGMIIVKRTDGNGSWIVWHRSLSNSTTSFLRLESNVDEQNAYIWGSNAPNSTHFEYDGGAIGRTFVAYLFAHNDGSFGEDSDEAVIKCGSYTGTGASGNQITLGFEPQWLMVKNTSSSNQNWEMFDNMRGVATGSTAVELFPNTTSAERSSFNIFNFNATGFETESTLDETNANGDSYIYIAIRRPHKPPEAATDVFQIDVNTQSEPEYVSNFVVDWAFHRNVPYTDNFESYARLTGTNRLELNNNSAQSANSTAKFDFMDGWGDNLANNTNYRSWMFRRAPGFFDVVAWAGTSTDGASTTVLNHNLAATPELIIGKKRGHLGNWTVYSSVTGINKELELNGNAAVASVTNMIKAAPTDSTYTVGYGLNQSGRDYVGYFFASLPGISKIGSYTGTGSAGNNVDCGFTNGARFVMVKRTDSSGDWFVADTTRGINAGSDPFLKLNTTDAENNTVDWIDAYSAGFTINGTGGDFNASGGTYLFLAIA